MRWGQFRRGQKVRFYTADGWKKGVVAHVYDNSATVSWSVGSINKTTRVYDTRNIKPEQ